MIGVLFLLVAGAYILLLYGLISAESLITWQHFMIVGVIVWIIMTAALCGGLFARALHISKLLSDFPLRVQGIKNDYPVFVEIVWQLRGLEAEQKIVTLVWLGAKPPQSDLENALMTLDKEGYASTSVKLIRDQALSNVDLDQRFLETFQDLSSNGFYYQNDNYDLVQERFTKQLHALLLLNNSNTQWWQNVICAATLCVSQHLTRKDNTRKIITDFLNQYHLEHAGDEGVAPWKLIYAQYGIDQAHRQMS